MPGVLTPALKLVSLFPAAQCGCLLDSDALCSTADVNPVLCAAAVPVLLQALDFRLGVFHVECKYTSRGARLIEVNARMGGGPVR